MLAKNSSFGFFSVGLCVIKNKCAICGSGFSVCGNSPIPTIPAICLCFGKIRMIWMFMDTRSFVIHQYTGKQGHALLSKGRGCRKAIFCTLGEVITDCDRACTSAGV